MSHDSFIDESDLHFKIPSGMIISGPSNSGKTQLLLRILDNYRDIFSPVPEAIVYCYGEYHSFIPKLKSQGIHICSGVPAEGLLENLPRPYLLILDDLMLTLNERTLSELFTKRAHHQNFGVIFITQNLFERVLRVARNNSQYIILMRAPNAVLQIRNLGAQLFPGQLSYFMDAYRKATEKPYGYLVLDLHAGSLPSLRLRTHIFPDDSEKIIFTPI